MPPSDVRYFVLYYTFLLYMVYYIHYMHVHYKERRGSSKCLPLHIIQIPQYNTNIILYIPLI